MGKKNLLESPNFIGPNRPNTDSKRVILRGCETFITVLQTCFSQCSFWEKVPIASHDDIITGLHHEKTGFKAWRSLWGLNLDDEARRLLCRGSYGQAKGVK